MGRVSDKFPYVSLYAHGAGWRLTTASIGGRRITRRLGTNAAFARRRAQQVSEWMEQLRAGLLTEAKVLQLLGESLAIGGVVEQYRADLSAKGRSEDYINTIVPRLRILFEHAEADQVKHLTIAAIHRGIEHLREHGHHGQTLSDQTLQHYQAAARQFAKWCKRRGLVESDPLEDIEGLSVGEKAHARRAPTKLETQLLITHLWSQPRGRFNLDGRSRAMLYLYAMSTGYRAGELRHVRTGWIDPATGLLRVPGDYTKNGKAAMQPLPGWLVRETRDWLGERTGLLWPEMPSDTAKTLRLDQAAARAAWVAAAPSPEERDRRAASDVLVYRTAAGVFDFHALRHFYVTTIGRSGATVKDTQTLARHSTPMLTLGTYSHAEAEQLQIVVDQAFANPRETKGGD